MQKGKLFFNIIIIITVIALIAVVGYVAYYYINNYIALKEAEQAVEEFENEVIVVAVDEENTNKENNQIQQQTPQTNNTNKTVKKYYKGYTLIGTIQIPKTKVKAPIVDRVTTNSISAAVATLYGPRLKPNRKYSTSST